MKIQVNAQVRDAIRTDLPRACDEFDAAHAANDGSLAARVRITNANDGLKNVAALIMSHATRGRRYPMMTSSTWGRDRR